MTAFLEAVFWASLLVLAYVYAGFPAMLWLLTRGKSSAPPADPPDDRLPSISFLTAAHNEEPVIEEKIRNCLDLDYPAEKLHFVFVSDGSTDGTDAILERYASHPRVRVVLVPERGGKMRALRQGFPLCRSEVLALTDANTFYQPDALRKLARHFADPMVGCVTGDVRIRPSKQQFGEGESAYYRYERALQAMETAFWSAVGVDGAMYVLRRELLTPPSENIILDDFVISMNAARQGFRIVYDPEAIAAEDPTPTSGQEFWRKVRVVAGGYQAILQREGLPRLGQARLLWLYLSHKALRWAAPLFLLAMAASAAALAGDGLFWRVVLAGQGVFYLLAVAGWLLRVQRLLLLRIPYYFCLINLAALVGLARALRGRQSVIWRKAGRAAGSV
jgi:cellulose synthase/poly-beta-1,6-N-acetylglucosamine synthase-like glycosyltransferase